MPTPSDAHVFLDRVGRRFGDRWIFRNVTLDARSGECLALIGPNGSGKTTLLRVMATLLTPDEGEGNVCGHSLTQRPRRARRHLAYLPATERGFFPRLTGKENLLLHGYLRGLRRATIETRLGELAEVGAFKEALGTPFFLASSGMRQLLHLGRVALARPALYILDEPTRSLDSATTPLVHAFIRRLAADSVVVLASHSAEECRALNARPVTVDEWSKR